MGNIYSENNISAKIDPWGSPHIEWATEEEYLPMLTAKSSVGQKRLKPVKCSAPNTYAMLQPRQQDTVVNKIKCWTKV